MSNSNQPAADQAATIELLLHMLDLYSFGREGRELPQLLPGKLPDGLPFELPLPRAARIVGSTVNDSDVLIFFETALNADEVLDFYDEHFLGQGWVHPDLRGPHSTGGFDDQIVAHERETFCQGENGPWFRIAPHTRFAPPTMVQIGLHTNRHNSPCSPRHRPDWAMFNSVRNVLPRLTPPNGAGQYNGGAESSPEHVTNGALLVTDLDIATILKHYDGQLEQAGWVRRDNNIAGVVAASNWDFRFEDEAWHATLSIIGKSWMPDQYLLELKAEVEGYRVNGGLLLWQ